MSRLCGLNMSLFGVKLWIFYYKHNFGRGSNFSLQSLVKSWDVKTFCGALRTLFWKALNFSCLEADCQGYGNNFTICHTTLYSKLVKTMTSLFGYCMSLANFCNVLMDKKLNIHSGNLHWLLLPCVAYIVVWWKLWNFIVRQILRSKWIP